MKIRIIESLPIDSRHGLRIGMVLEAEEDTEDGERFLGAAWVTSPKTGKRIRLLWNEWVKA